ncbi:Cyclic di-GMP phosphodiesterase YfgF [compost metagenome]
MPAHKICFELTETAAVANLTKTADLVRYLQRFGCTFSIDDFGTGFSSYEYLKRLPVDYVKIDGSFVKEIERSPSDLAMVKSINEIAHVLGRKTIAEYVETGSIRERLVALGIDYVQGYGVQMPLPLEAFLAGC